MIIKCKRVFTANSVKETGYIKILQATDNVSMVEHGYYRPPKGGQFYDMKVVSGYAFLQTYYV